MKEKIQKAQELIGRCLDTYRDPALLCSFGKDSLALLGLLRGMGQDLPLVFFRKPQFPRKYGYANNLITEWNLVVHDFPPASISLQENPKPNAREQIDFVETYSFGGTSCIKSAYGIYEPLPGERFLCGFRDVLLRPRAMMQNTPWDLLFMGSKQCDDKPQGNLSALRDDLVRKPQISIAYPLRTWSEADVWNYIESVGLPIDEARYEKVAGVWRDREDKTANADFFPVCTRCMAKSAAQTVLCPELGHHVNRITESVPWETAPITSQIDNDKSG